MISQELYKKYIPTIGIETHVQLKTKSKLFSSVSNDDRNAPPNSLISHIDLGMPGALPVLNEEAVNLAVRAALALGVKPQGFSKFDRKHYFYPDLPKGYQITQFDEPVILGGFVEINLNGKPQKVTITRAHLEEDAGKSMHPTGKDYSLVDLNRAGTPLLEIVSDPVMHSADEAKVYVRELYLLMKYADVSEGDLYHGNMRFDVNVSVSKEKGTLGTRSETKNLNSFKSVAAAVNYEIKRQIELLEKGDKIVQETRGWDDAKQKTFSQRSKEEAHDYRYFPEPDIPPIEITADKISNISKTFNLMPSEIRKKLSVINVNPEVIEDLLFSGQKHANEILEVIKNKGENTAKRLIFWLFESGDIDVKRDVELSEMIEDNLVSTLSAKTIREEMLKTDASPQKIASDQGLLQESNEAVIKDLVKKIISDNPQAAEDIKNGEIKAIGFLVGQVMKESKGQANPGLTQKLIKQLIQD